MGVVWEGLLIICGYTSLGCVVCNIFLYWSSAKHLAGALLNILINAMVRPVWGIIGAALASFITQFFTNFLVGFFVKPIKDCNRLMLKGINPKFAFVEIRKLIDKKTSTL